MARKRKIDSSKSTESMEPPKKQQQKADEEPKKEEVAEEVEEYEEDPEEEETDAENEEEDGDGDDNQDSHVATNGGNQTGAETSGAGREGGNDGEDDDDEEEPIHKLLEPLSKDQILDLLRDAAGKHADVADRIRQVADEDPSHRKIFVHGLGWDTNADALTSVFIQYGEIEDCRAVCDKVSGKSKGYGFILFKKRSSARKALKEPQKKIGSRMAACQLASIGPVPTPNAAPSPSIQPVSEYTQKKIYVSNVAADLDPQKLLSFFSEFGEIEEGPLGLDKATGKPKGFCLFVYRTVESARKALEEPHKNFEGHTLHCQKAVDGPRHGKSQHNQHHHSHNTQFQRNRNSNYNSGGGAAAAGPGHLMAPTGSGIGFNQGPVAGPLLNPALGQALTAFLATQGGAGLGGLTNLLGSLGSAASLSVPVATPGMQAGYPNQQLGGGVIGGYGNQGGVHSGYPNQQIGQGGGSGRGQYGGPRAYMGH